MGNYDDIIDLPHHVSSTRPQMPRYKRAAQFAPFAALKGYDEKIAEVQRLTEPKREPDEDRINKINTTLRFLNDHASEQPETTVVYFIPDEKKSGGCYTEVKGSFLRIDEYKKQVILVSGKQIPIDDIYDISVEGAEF